MVLEDRDIQYLKRHLLRNNVVLFSAQVFQCLRSTCLGSLYQALKN